MMIANTTAAYFRVVASPYSLYGILAIDPELEICGETLETESRNWGSVDG